MKRLNIKIKATLVVCALSLVSGSVFAETLTWSTAGEDAYKELTWKSWYSRSRFQTTTYNTKIQLVALNNSTSVKNAFSDFTVRKVEGLSLSGNSVRVSTIGTESCQCVAFVKEMTGYTLSARYNWNEGESLSTISLSNLQIGTAIATFDDHGNYDNRHTAIVIGKSGAGDWIDVIDQNWIRIEDSNFNTRENDPSGAASPNCDWNNDVDDKGIVSHHRIYFQGHSGINDADNYSIIDVNR